MESESDEDAFNVNYEMEMDSSEDQASNGSREPVDEDDSDEEEQQFDITLAATHSYMGSSLRGVSGRSVLEGGARTRLPALVHHSVVFPGETVPMLLNDPRDAQMLADTLTTDKLFGLLFPDETMTVLSGYGVVCEVFEAALEPGAGAGAPPDSVSFKARAVYRFRVHDMPKRAPSVASYVRLRALEVVVLGEEVPEHPLRRARLAALDTLRRPSAPHTRAQAWVRRLDAAVCPWPGFVFDMFDYSRMRLTIQRHCRALGLEKLMPREPVSLSFWVASNLPLAPRDRLALFALDAALLRLHTECRLLAREAVLCCATCGTELAARDHALGMSSDGAHGNYSNPGGHLHDVITVSAARNTRAAGPKSEHYSWFPGYAWSVRLCAGCAHHVGWRFDAETRALRPRTFYALCRNYVVPRDAARLPPDTPPL